MFNLFDSRFRRTFAPVAMALALAIVAGCTPDDDLDEPRVQTVRLLIGTTAYNIDAGTGLTAPITIGLTANTVTATFLHANGQIDPLVNEARFELRLEGLDPSIATFTRTGAFTGTLTGVAVGSDNSVTVELFHLEDQHRDFQKTVTVQVN